MDRWLRRIALPVGVCVLGLATWVPRWNAAQHQLSTVAWLSVALIVVAAGHYRTSRDPDAMLMATAGAILAMQSLFATILFSGSGGADLEARAIATASALAGWAVAAFCLLLASPWWERRGRPRIASVGLGAGILGVVVATDLLLLAFPPPTSEDADILASALAPISGIGWIWLSVAIAIWALVALRRMLLIRRGAQHAAIVAAALAAIVALVAWAVLALPVGSSAAEWIGPLVWMQPVAIASLLVAVVLMERSDVSRMRRVSDRADQIVEGRAEIASMIAHEVRGPVTTIRGIASTASTHYERLSDDERQEFFSLIEQESRRLLGSVDQTSLALKIDAGSLTFQKAPIPLATVVRAGVDAAEVAPELHAVHVIAQEDVSLFVDASRVTEVIRQLVDNASKYSPAGTPIIVRAVADDDSALVEITDEGPGVPPEQREAVFERFTRWRPSGYEEQPGNGLGLFICRALVVEHQGEMSVEDGPDGGTMLRVRLPLEGT